MATSEAATAALSAAPKGHYAGTHRVVSPEETWRRVAPLFGRVGITRVANITGLDVLGVPVVAVVRPQSRSITVAQGKGIDLVSAKVSAVMESIENFHAEHIDAPLMLASWDEMRDRGATLDVSRVPRVQGSTFDPGHRLLWIKAFEALGGAALFVPFELVHTDYRLPLPTGSGAFLMSDSGVASGNHPLEATSHAVCELVERDAVTLWRYLPDVEQRRRRLDLDTIDDEPCRRVIERFARAGVELAVWDVTSDVGIACFFCTLYDGDKATRPVCPSVGSGCHPCREVALLRALTEAAQTRLTIIAGSRDDIGIATYRRGHDPVSVLELRRRLGSERGEASFASVPTHVTPSLREDVQWELQRLRAVGIEQVAVVDLTRPELAIPVVRVVIPGLEALYDAVGFTPGQRLRSRVS